MLKKTDFITASVEAGNTTTKCILTAADMKTGHVAVIGKCIRLTREMHAPKIGEKICGKTLTGTEFTIQSLAELVRDTVNQALFENHLSVNDVHFAVRSTGVTAESDEKTGMIIQALAIGCLEAGLTPRQMTGYLDPSAMPENLRPHSYLDKVIFDGAVAGVMPPKFTAGNIVSNEMEGELAVAGIKEAAKHTALDFRNPCLVLDMGTTLSGRIVGNEKPYAKTVGNFCGYAGAVSDALIQNIDCTKKSALEFFSKTEQKKSFLSSLFSSFSSFLSFLSFLSFSSSGKKIKTAQKEVRSLLRIMAIPPETDSFGPFFINTSAAKEKDFVLIGCDIGQNGSNIQKLSEIGQSVYENGGNSAIKMLVDEVMSDIAVDLIRCAMQQNAWQDDMVIGITGRAATTGKKKELIIQKLSKFIEDPESKVIFSEDGLARGAAVMARCMNSLGCPNNPIGGNRGSGCIMKERQKYQNKY
jgi:putative methanogenesis marker protein 14